MSSWSEVQNIDVQFQIPLKYSHRTHKFCKLSNGIPVLLVSDPTDTSSVCSVTVATGSHNDPRGIPGIAHLCEHMLFAGGSKKYPNPETYHKLLSKNNGLHNAHTTGEQTTFYFQIPNTQHDGELKFNEVVDIFSSLLEDPLFNITELNKELYAIQSEHDGNISDLNKILYHSIRLLSNEKHPFHQFSTGNIYSLKNLTNFQKVSLKAILNNYFNENFIAKNMTICIRGPQSVNILTKLAITKFSKIKKERIFKNAKFSNLTRKYSFRESLKAQKKLTKRKGSFNILEDIWKPKYDKINCFELNDKNVIFIQSNKQKTIRLLFPISENSTRFTGKEISIFSNLWCQLFGDESPGSICYNFKQKGWILDCLAYISKFAVGNTGLLLEMSLTGTGINNINELIREIFDNATNIFINKNTESLAVFIYENALTEYINFLYQDTDNSNADFCSEMSEALQNNLNNQTIEYLFKETPNIIELNTDSFENLLGVTQWWVGQAILFQNFLREFINIKNLKIVLLGDSRTYQKTTNSSILQALDPALHKECELDTDLYYEFEYLIKKLNIKRLIRKKDHEIITNELIFQVPASNIFIPELYPDIAKLQQTFMECSLRSKFVILDPDMSLKLPNKSQPQLVNKTTNYEMWILNNNNHTKITTPNENSVTDRNNLVNKSVVTFNINSKIMTPSPRNTIQLEVFTEVLNNLLLPILYPSLNIGYYYEIMVSVKGEIMLEITVSGFNSGVLKIIETICDTINEIVKNPQTVTKEMFRHARITTRGKYENAASDSCVKLASMGLLILLERNMWTLEDRLDALEEADFMEFVEFCQNFFGDTHNNYLTLFIEGDIQVTDTINELLHAKLTHHLNSSRCGTPMDNTNVSSILLPFGTNDFIEYNGHEDDINNSIVYFIQTGLRSNSKVYTLTAFTEYLMSITLVPDLRNKRQIGYIVLGGMRILSQTMGLHVTVMSHLSPQEIEKQIDEYLKYLEDDILELMTEQEFKNEFLLPFKRLITKDGTDDIENTGGPSNLFHNIPPNITNGDSNQTSIRKHRAHMNQILDHDYNFRTAHEVIDLKIINELNLTRYLRFFQEQISIFAPMRAQLSVMIKSPVSEKEIKDCTLFLQMEQFFKMKGIAIQKKDLRDIVEQSQGSPTALLRLLFKHFRNRGEALRLLQLITNEVAAAAKSQWTLTLDAPKRKKTPRGKATDHLRSRGREFARNLERRKLLSPNFYRFEQI